MATLKQKIEAEQKMRNLLEDNGLPAPDAVEYGYACVRFFWHESKACVIVDIDEPDVFDQEDVAAEGEAA